MPSALLPELIPRTHGVGVGEEKPDSGKLSSDLSMYTVACVCLIVQLNKFIKNSTGICYDAMTWVNLKQATSQRWLHPPHTHTDM